MTLHREKKLNHKQHFELEQCASSALPEPKCDKAGYGLHQTKSEK